MVLDTLFGFRIDSVVKAQYKSYVKQGVINPSAMNEGLRLTFNILMADLKLGNTALIKSLVDKENKLEEQKLNKDTKPLLLRENPLQVQSTIENSSIKAQNTNKGLDTSWMKLIDLSNNSKKEEDIDG